MSLKALLNVGDKISIKKGKSIDLIISIDRVNPTLAFVSGDIRLPKNDNRKKAVKRKIEYTFEREYFISTGHLKLANSRYSSTEYKVIEKAPI